MLMWILLIIVALILFVLLSRGREKGDEEVVLPPTEDEDMEFGEEPFVVDSEGGSELESIEREEEVENQITRRDNSLLREKKNRTPMEVGHEIKPKIESKSNDDFSGRVKVLEISWDDEEEKQILNVGSIDEEERIPAHDMPLNLELSPRLIALPKDPNWIHLYWNLPAQVPQGKWEVKVKNLTKQNEFYQPVDPDTGNWYLNLKQPNQEFSFELGVWNESGHFQVILSSNSICTPADRPSDVIDSEWATIDEMYNLRPEEFGGASEQLMKH